MSKHMSLKKHSTYVCVCANTVSAQMLAFPSSTLYLGMLNRGTLPSH